MNRFLITIILIFIGSFGYSQPCPSGNLFIYSQADLDEFVANYPDCTELEGLDIYASSFEGLDNITHINDGGLGIYGTEVMNFAGLENLEYIGGHLYIEDCHSLVSLEGINNLVNVGGDVFIVGNDNLENLDGLESLQYIGGLFSLGNTSLIKGVLTSIEGLNQLTSIGEGLSIIGCELLSNLDGLENLETTGKFLRILGNPLLEDISALQGIDSIHGQLYIGGSFLTTLTGLENVKYIEGILISYNEFLNDITLNSLNYVNGGISIHSNKNLLDLDGLFELDSIGGFIDPQGNYSAGFKIGGFSDNNISSLAGLSNLKKVDGGLIILHQDSLTNIDGLEGLHTVTGTLGIQGNDNLEDLNALSSLINVDEVYITDNSVLDNIDGISNINPFILNGLIITSNPLLSDCNIFSVCGYLLTQNGELNISSNGWGCNTISDLSQSCDIGPCMIDYIEFTSQEEIDSFLDNTAFCNEIEGDVLISGDDITNLEGLSVISHIGGSLIIQSNPILTDITGLFNIGLIGGDLTIQNNTTLSSLQGLNNLTTLNGSLSISDNDSLKSILPFLDLNDINGDLIIEGNQSLLSIKGLRHIEATGINNLYINDNPQLSACDYQSICDYIATPSGVISVSNNATGCSSFEELEAACEYGYCLLGGIEFTNQNDVSNFHYNYPNCDVIEGDLSIQNPTFLQMFIINNLDSLNSIVKVEGNVMLGEYSDALDALTSLSGLDNLVEIEGDLTISSNILTNLNGLESLTTVNSISLLRNDALQTLDGLEGINSLEGKLEIGYSSIGAPYLNDLQALANLSTIGGDLIIRGTESLSNLEGLENLVEIKGNLSLSENGGIHNLNGLENIETIGGAIGFSGNNQLEDISALIQIDSIHGGLYFYNNLSIENLEGLNNLEFINGSINITSNEALSDISALYQVSADSIDNLTIYNNPLLAVCEIDPVCDFISYLSENAFIYNNAENCNSIEEVILSCEGCYPNGVVFTSQEEIDNFPLLTEGCSIIWGDLIISGEAIQNVDSLSGIHSINGNLIIENNPSLENLYGFSGLYTINDNDLIIYNNDALSTLIGLDNIYDQSFNYLEIADNENLSNCSVESICSHLSYFGDHYVNNNNGSCLTELEVAISCDLMNAGESPFQLYPNPSDGILNVASYVNAPVDQITIYNQVGIALYASVGEVTLLDISFLDSGIYIVEILSEGNYYQNMLLVY